MREYRFSSLFLRLPVLLLLHLHFFSLFFLLLIFLPILFPKIHVRVWESANKAFSCILVMCPSE